MALKPRDKKHKKQIEAGIEGRSRGHEFEEALAEDINQRDYSKLDFEGTKKHLVVGRPSDELIKYILKTEKIREFSNIIAAWYGGLATMNRGNDLPEKAKAKGSKSDIVITIMSEKGKKKIGVSVKTCNTKTPTNDQLFCTTASAFCNLLRDNDIEVSSEAEIALKMFCGEKDFRPLDNPKKVKNRKSDPRRYFWEELPKEAKDELETLFSVKQKSITRILLRNAYTDDPIPPDYIFHQRVRCDDIDKCKIALFAVDELVQQSVAHGSFWTSKYRVRKGTYKSDQNTHEAPRFGFIQFQRLGNKQNATQLQFNLKAGYFNKLKNLEDSQTKL
ncbi:MAG: hypothetical protein ABEK36_02095 [Candidatus Aenigmatarchaeota archaeon]